jgi:uncharacterized membrane protein YcaP (DUF421 family)
VPPVQWDKLFILTVSPIELVIRGSIIYLFILVLMRILRREPGTIGIADLLMVVLIADASQNAMSGEYHSVLDGLLLVVTIVFWNYLMDWLSFRSKLVERFAYPPPITLFQNRLMYSDNMRKQFITPEQLFSVLREHGIDDISKVKAVFLEGSGHVSVIPVNADAAGPENERRKHRVG